MTRKIQVHQVDAFTREPFTGNPTGVVLNADALTEAQMLAIARELNNAETAFILSPDGADHTVRARFFTPRSEAGFVGHAPVGRTVRVIAPARRAAPAAAEVQGRDRRHRGTGHRTGSPHRDPPQPPARGARAQRPRAPRVVRCAGARLREA